MSQQIEIMTVRPGDQEAQEALNRFLRGHRILTVEKVFDGGAWHFCISWQPAASSPDRDGKGKNTARVDYREILDAPTFALFAHLREVRKQLAEKERLPAFAILTNEQLAEVAKGRCSSLADLRKIEGIGDGRIEKYGGQLIEAIENHEKQSSKVGGDSGTGKSA